MLWTLAVTIPVYTIAAFEKDVELIIQVTGGFAGVYLLLFLPPIMVHFARKKYRNELLANGVGENCHEMMLKSSFWEYFTLIFGIIVLGFQIKGYLF